MSFRTVLTEVDQQRTAFDAAQIFKSLIGVVGVHREGKLIDIEFSNLGEVMSRLCAHAGKESSLEFIRIEVGMGGSETAPSLRLPGCVVPIIESLELLSQTLADIGWGDVALPRVHIFQAIHMANYVNGFNLDLMKRTSSLTLRYLEEFIREATPTLCDRFDFQVDQDWLGAENEENLALVCDLEASLRALEEKGMLRNEFLLIKRMGRSHGKSRGEGGALRYAAVHPLYNGAIQPSQYDLKIFRDTNNVPSQSGVSLLLDFGGRAQKTFNSISAGLAAHLDPQKFHIVPQINIIHSYGAKKPVYYLDRDSDWELGKLLSVDEFKNLPRHVRREIDSLKLFCAARGFDYLKFHERFSANLPQ